MLKVNFINNDFDASSPASFRVISFKSYFSEDYVINNSCLLKYGKEFNFYSMPPFRGFLKFLLSSKPLILDIRDGWSISQSNGYGGIVRKRPIRAWLTKKIENFLIKKSFITITCTPGLKDYLEKISSKSIMLIPNGLSEERYLLIKDLKEGFTKVEKSKLVFVCSGKFSEYGEDNVRKLLDVIAKRYSNSFLEVRLIGACLIKNEWAVDYFKKITKGNGVFKFMPRMFNDKNLYRAMLDADYGLAVVRDPEFELGTKIYDYIALGLPVVNYFDKPNNFTNYFDAYLDVPFNSAAIKPEIIRSRLIEKAFSSERF